MATYTYAPLLAFSESATETREFPEGEAPEWIDVEVPGGGFVYSGEMPPPPEVWDAMRRRVKMRFYRREGGCWDRALWDACGSSRARSDA